MRNSFFRIGILPVFLIFIMLVFEPPGISLPSLSAAVIHECGHLAAARLLGIRLRSLDIGPLGATIQTRGYLIPYMHEWLLCAAGPAANFATCAIIYACFSGTERFTPGGTGFNLCTVSLLLGALNLLPKEGFDGGRMLSVLVCGRHGPRAAAISVTIGSVVSVTALWMLSVYLLLRWGSSPSLFIFSASVFCRVFLENDSDRSRA